MHSLNWNSRTHRAIAPLLSSSPLLPQTVTIEDMLFHAAMTRLDVFPLKAHELSEEMRCTEPGVGAILFREFSRCASRARAMALSSMKREARLLSCVFCESFRSGRTLIYLAEMAVGLGREVGSGCGVA
ncbi:MAG: hypothetical protein EOP04_21150 [Proteobacteria bacterium]|nr:MAG: hypothetical protein EOP04_21150 [Pseudomonadota bacterium]